jgi:methyl-accepting chemotaxis protein
MSLFSLFKHSSSLDDAFVSTFMESCQRMADGDPSAVIDTDVLDGPQAQIACAFNAAADRAAKRMAANEEGIRRSVQVIENLQNGNFESRLINIKEEDDTASLMHSINNFADVTDAFVREAGASLNAVSHNIYYRKVFTTGLRGEYLHTAEKINKATNAMGEKFDDFTALTERLVENIRNIANSISAMGESVTEVSTIAGDASDRSTTVAAAVEETTTSLQSIASAAEEMLVSVAEINRQVTHSTNITQDASQHVTESNTIVQTLADAASNISEVLNLISLIAGQTNLLALNATIEAARAGDAGKGFAVVASEVKSLASQTSKATEEIASQVGALQGATKATVETIENLGGVVNQINEISGAIASAITEQEATTREISSNIQNAATGSQEVADNMQKVSTGALKNRESANVLQTMIADVEQKSVELVTEATDFLTTARKTGTD